jgi:A/G-specific adenine glycosylase
MLQQTQVKTVVPYWERWMRGLPDIAALARAKPERLLKLWEGLGYYTRVRNMQRAAQIVMQRHQGEFPRDFGQVLELPGIGRYTAGAICSIAFNQPKPILDGNVVRVLARLFGVGGDPRGKSTNGRLWRLAEELVRATSNPGALNQSLMELGALVCTPREPRCGRCPVARQCVAKREDRVLELPGRKRRGRTTARRFVAFVAERRGRLLVRQRPAGVVNARLWEFPNVEVGGDGTDLAWAAAQALGPRARGFEPLGVVKHSITRYRMTLEVYRVERCGGAAGRWLGPEELEGLAFASAHRRILGWLGRRG